MKHVLTAAVAATLLCSVQAQAQESRGRDGDRQQMREQTYEQREERRARRERERNDARATEERAAREKAEQEQAERQRAEKENADREAARRADSKRQQADRNNRDRDRDRDWNRDRDGRDRDRADRTRWDNDRDRPRWARGERVPERWRDRRYVVSDWRGRGLRQPPRGHHWIHNDRGDFFLAAIGTGLVVDIRLSDDRDRGWRKRYGRMYSRDDDIYYSECRNQPDPAGVLVGALIGGLLGNEIAGRGDRTGATVAGVIVGGTMGAALTNQMSCEDRSYAYRSYYDGFNAGRPNTTYNWRNPRNDHRGEFRVGRYYDDPDGFRCATYTQELWINGRRQEADGEACRQPDGTWAIVN